MKRLFALVLLFYWPANAQDQSELDCVIEPRSIVDLTSADEGIIREIFVARGDRVDVGASVAQLDDETEQLQADLAEVR